MKTDGSTKPESDINFNGYKITNLKNPENDQDGVTKSYFVEHTQRKRVVYDKFIQSGNEVMIDTSANPDWKYVFISVKLDTLSSSLVIFRKVATNKKNLTARCNLNYEITDNFLFNIQGDVELKHISNDSVLVRVFDFGTFTVERPITFTAKDNDPKYGVDHIEIV